MSPIFLAKENYEFLRQHPACSKESLWLDGSGRLYLREISGLAKTVLDVDSQKGVRTAQIRAEIWGHLIPETKRLRDKELLSDADLALMQTLRGEIKKLREENSSFSAQVQELLGLLESSLPLQPTKSFFAAHRDLIAGLGKLGLASTAIASIVCAVSKLNMKQIAEQLTQLDETSQNLLIGAEFFTLASLMVLAKRSSLQSENPLKQKAYNAAAVAILVGIFCLPVINNAMAKILR